MADKTISALPSATTPLAGTEVLPIVQGGVTTKVAVSNLTANRAVATGALTASGLLTVSYTNPKILVDANEAINDRTAVIELKAGSGTDANSASIIQFSNGGGATTHQKLQIKNSSGTSVATFTNDLLLGVGNIVPSTAAKGINFTANTPAAGKTSQLLNWYEEGTWTPAQGAGLTLVGAFNSTGKYTRIGRSVTISGTVTGATSVAVTAAGVITSNLPFTAGTAGHGSATNAANTAFASVICTTTNVTSAGAIGATATITFSATYFV